MKTITIKVTKKDAKIIARFLDKIDKEKDGIPSPVQSIGEACWSFAGLDKK